MNIRRCKDNDIVPSFEDYLKSDKKYILSVIESGDKPEFSSYYRMFVQSASELNVTAVSTEIFLSISIASENE